MATTAIPTTRISGGSFLLEERKGDEVFTPEDFTEQHQLIGQTAEEFAINEIVPNIEKMEGKDFSITRDLLKKAGLDALNLDAKGTSTTDQLNVDAHLTGAGGLDASADRKSVV